jgi:hypothetical protein
MGESATEKRLKALHEIERDLLRAVEIAGAEFHASVNGDRKDAAATFAAALHQFNRFILDRQTPSDPTIADL